MGTVFHIEDKDVREVSGQIALSQYFLEENLEFWLWKAFACRYLSGVNSPQQGRRVWHSSWR